MAGKGFVLAGQLAVGNNIVTRAGPDVVIVKIEDVHLKKSVPVYNLTVSNDHTYFVGTANGGEWVHNACNQLHHIYPQKFRSFFEGVGLDIDNYTVDLGSSEHLSGVHGRGGFPFPNGNPGTTPGRYNNVWKAWIDANPNADINDVKGFGQQMLDQYGLNGLPIVPYK